jgi:hypothetical protein
MAELSGSEADTVAHCGVVYGEIVANRRAFAGEVDFYTRKCPDQMPAFVQMTVEQEYERVYSGFYQENPNTSFPRSRLSGIPKPPRRSA